MITASGVYVMGENDSPKIAKDAARQEAMRAATEKAGVYVESYSRTQNMELSADEVKVISGAVLKVLQEKAEPELKDGVWKYSVTLTCEVDTDNIDLKNLLENRNKLEKLQQERDALKKQNQELLEKYKQAKGQEKEKIGTELESQYSLQDVFDRCARFIQQGEQRRAIFELNKVINDRKVTDSPLAYAYYLRGRAYYERNMDNEALTDFAAAETTPHNDKIYPVWRTHYYQGLIYSDREQWERAYRELQVAWDACGHQDEEIEAAMLRARRHLQTGNPEPRRRTPHQKTKETDWEKVVSDVLIDILQKEAAKW
jgi:tetratricopeptide (TPR) repeat protein